MLDNIYDNKEGAGERRESIHPKHSNKNNKQNDGSEEFKKLGSTDGLSNKQNYKR